MRQQTEDYSRHRLIAQLHYLTNLKSVEFTRAIINASEKAGVLCKIILWGKVHVFAPMLTS